MKKFFFIVLAVLLVFITAGTIYFFSKEKGDGGESVTKREFNSYRNEAYGFSFEYPRTWHLMGDSSSSVIQLSNVEEPSGDGGVPFGIRTEIFVIPNEEGKDLEEWISWANEWSPTVALSREWAEIGIRSAVREVYEPLQGPVANGSPISYYAFLPGQQYVIQFNYLGREPDYSDNLIRFERLLKSYEEKDWTWNAFSEIKLKEECEALGGAWRRWSFWQDQEECDLPYSDAGTVCNDSFDCLSGQCFYNGADPVEGETAKGECASFTSISCVNHHYFIEKGKIVNNICIE